MSHSAYPTPADILNLTQFDLPRSHEKLAKLTAKLSELSLPKRDFGDIIALQMAKAKELRDRLLAPPTLGERFLNFVEGPWAPSAHDLPDRRDQSGEGGGSAPFRTAAASRQSLKNRHWIKSEISRSEYRWPLSQWTSVYEYDVPIQRLPQDLHGFTILHLSDIHVLKGNSRPCEELARMADFLESGKRRIDMILLSGDIITKSPEDLNSFALRQLHRMSDVCPQSFMVYGNHDYHGHTPALISRALEMAGFHDINNHRVSLKIGNSHLNLYGIDDAYFGTPTPPTSVRADQVNVVLTHNLDAIRGNFPCDIDLILSGHTHWGEVKLFDGSSLMRIWGYCDNINRHTKAWDMLNDRTLSFVHPGLARYYVPFRGLRHPPGIAIHSLYGVSTNSR